MGAPALMLDNLNPSKGFANGTEVRLHAIRYNCADLRAEAEAAIEAWRRSGARGGERITVPFPDIIDVAVPSILASEENSHERVAEADTLVNARDDAGHTLFNPDGSIQQCLAKCVVIPLPTWDALKKGGITKHTCIKIGKANPCTHIKFHDHPVTLSFARTYHKLQGQTKRKLILDIGNYPGRGSKLLLKHFYVGMSRTKRRDDLRFLPIVGDKKARWRQIEKFTQDMNLNVYLGRFAHDGCAYNII